MASEFAEHFACKRKPLATHWTSPGTLVSTETWPTVWFKGGSEPGVLTLGFYAKRLNGERAVVVMMVSNATRAFDEQSVVLELETLIRGAFGLVK